MTEKKPLYGKSMFPQLLGANMQTINWRSRRHPLPEPRAVIMGAGRDTYGWYAEDICTWWNSYPLMDRKNDSNGVEDDN